MSAIAAIWRFDGPEDVRDAAERMSLALEIHGPDQQGLGIDGNVGLAWRGRIVLPEDPADRQPLSGRGGVLLVSDGRIDNREELHTRLGLRGGTGVPDSHYLLAAYETWGEECVAHLVGDFAFVIWDPRAKRLFAARDPLGMRPLFFHRGDRFLAIASMPRGLFALPEVPKRLNPSALLSRLLLLPDLGSETLFDGIERIPPGHTLSVTASGTQLREYWRPDPEKRLDLPSDEAYVDAFKEILDEAVRCRLRAVNTAFASELSGGFDSSTVTSIAADHLAGVGGRLRAYTGAPRDGFDGAVPGGQLGDESALAALVAAGHPNIEHHVVRRWERGLDHLDQFADAAEMPMPTVANLGWQHPLNEAARAHGATVMLSGVFGNMTISHRGWQRFSELTRRGHWLTLAREIAAFAGRPEGSLRAGFQLALIPNLPGPLYRVMRWRKARSAGGPFRNTAVNPRRYPRATLEAHARAHGRGVDPQPWRDSRAMRAAMLGRLDMGPLWMGLEAVYGMGRADPTGDKRLVEFCLAVPEAQYFADGVDRRLLRRAMNGRLPEPLLAEIRRGHQGADWYEHLRADAEILLEEINDLKRLSPLACELLDLESMEHALRTLPDEGWERAPTIATYRLKLLRGITIGRFMRRFEARYR